MKRVPILAAMALATPLYAEGYIAIAPVFSQIVTMPVPDGFVAAHEAADADNYINEAVPEGESVNAWSQMITLTGFRGGATGNGPADSAGYANYLAGLYQSACPDTFYAVTLTAPQVRGAENVFAGFLGCGDNTMGQSETMAFLVLVGAQDIYSLQWAERGPMVAGPPSYDADIWAPRLGDLTATARICDPVAGEEPPYPSCIGG